MSWMAREICVGVDVGAPTPSKACFYGHRSLTASTKRRNLRHFSDLAAVIFDALMVSPFISPVSFTSCPACEAMVFEL